MMHNQFILTADLHLRTTRPRCRLDDDWLFTQQNVLAQISKQANDKKVPVVVVGDIFNSNIDVSNELMTIVQTWACACSCGVFMLAGNHDLPYHNVKNLRKSSIGVLLGSRGVGEINDLYFHLDDSIVEQSANHFGVEQAIDAEIIFEHILCLPEKIKLPDEAEVTYPKDLFEKYKKARYIFTGDYHRFFIASNKGETRYVINPGCVIRQAADLIDYKPHILYINLDEEDISKVVTPIPIDDFGNLVTDEYLQREEERNDRIESFIERVKSSETVSFDFLENVNARIRDKKIDKKTKEVVLELIGT